MLYRGREEPGRPSGRLAFVERIGRGGLVVAALGIATLGAVGSPASAQTASQITPPSFRPAPPRVGGTIAFSGRPGLDAPAGADRLSVRIARVSIDGALPELAGEYRAFEERLVGRRVLASEIFTAARDLEAAHARLGYVLARVVLPAQTLQDGGSLKLVIVNGFIERVELKNVPEVLRSRIDAVVAPLVGQQRLRLGEIERRLLLAGDTPGVALRSALSPGTAPGGTVLVIEALYRPVTGFLGIDNTLANSLGRTNLNLGLDINSVLGFGETFYARASGHPGGGDTTGVGSLFGDTPRTRTLAGGLLFPIGIDGLTLNIEGTESLTAPKAFDFVQTDSIFDRLSVRLRYPWVRTRSFNLASEFIFDAEEEKVRLTVPAAVFPLSLDRLRVLRAAIDANRQFESGGILAGRAVASAGVDAFGARSRADATLDLPLSRDGADADFQKLEALVTYAQPMAEHLGVAIYARGQTSFNQALARAEQIGIASFRELSTFDAGTLGGDSGWIIRGDVSSPWTFPVGAVPVSFTPYAFAATGTLYLERPTIFEQKITRVSSFGIGLNLGTSLGPGLPEATLTLEFGRRIRDDGSPDGNRFTFVGAIQF